MRSKILGRYLKKFLLVIWTKLTKSLFTTGDTVLWLLELGCYDRSRSKWHEEVFFNFLKIKIYIYILLTLTILQNDKISHPCFFPFQFISGIPDKKIHFQSVSIICQVKFTVFNDFHSIRMSRLAPIHISRLFSIKDFFSKCD